MQHDIVEGIAAAHRLPVTIDHGVQQQPFFLGILAGEDFIQPFEHMIGRDVGEKAESALVDAEQRDFVIRQRARRVEQGAVAADDDDEVALLAELAAFGDVQPVAGHQFGGRLIEQYLEAALADVRAQGMDGGPDVGVTEFADESDTTECACHKLSL